MDSRLFGNYMDCMKIMLGMAVFCLRIIDSIKFNAMTVMKPLVPWPQDLTISNPLLIKIGY